MNHCPCVTQLRPDFLRGSCGPHPANDEKRHRLYKRLLSDLRVWVDDEYLERKERRTAIQDRREIIPKCVITLRELLYWQLHNYTVPFTHCRRLGRGTLAPIGTIGQHSRLRRTTRQIWRTNPPPLSDCTYHVVVKKYMYNYVHVNSELLSSKSSSSE